MPNYYYGVQTALTYVINHFFLKGTHFTWVAGEYYPYRKKNPQSSNPHKIYGSLFEAWREKDNFSKDINQYRMNLRNGLTKCGTAGRISKLVASELTDVADRISTNAFYPIIYRVDVNRITPSRLTLAGSGLKGSNEFLIADLQESEIDLILFNDYRHDKLINQFVRKEFEHFRSTGTYGWEQREVIDFLLERCK